MVKEKLFGIANFIKKVYLLLFNFMLGKQTRKGLHFFAHAMTVLLLFLFPYVYISNVILPLLTGAEALHGNLSELIMITASPIVLAYATKLMMTFYKRG